MGPPRRAPQVTPHSAARFPDSFASNMRATFTSGRPLFEAISDPPTRGAALASPHPRRDPPSGMGLTPPATVTRLRAARRPPLRAIPPWHLPPIRRAGSRGASPRAACRTWRRWRPHRCPARRARPRCPGPWPARRATPGRGWFARSGTTFTPGITDSSSQASHSAMTPRAW